jgi:hypothetical protein
MSTPPDDSIAGWPASAYSSPGSMGVCGGGIGDGDGAAVTVTGDTAKSCRLRRTVSTGVVRAAELLRRM